jgi:ABC-type phosphate transport system permease subunit
MSAPDLAITHDIVVARSLRGKRVDAVGTGFQILLLASLLLALAALVVLIGTVLTDGLPVFRERGFVIGEFPSSYGSTWGDIADVLAHPEGVGWLVTPLAVIGVPVLLVWLGVKRRWKIVAGLLVAILATTALAALVGTSDFLTSPLSRIPSRAGVSQAIFGTVMLAVFTALVALPLGVATAVYLEEYARPGRFTNFVRLNIRNLAGVPSVVYRRHPAGGRADQRRVR